MAVTVTEGAGVTADPAKSVPVSVPPPEVVYVKDTEDAWLGFSLANVASSTAARLRNDERFIVLGTFMKVVASGIITESYLKRVVQHVGQTLATCRPCSENKRKGTFLQAPGGG